MDVTITYDSIFDLESHLNKTVGVCTPAIQEWFYQRVEPNDIKQSKLTGIFHLLNTIVASEKATVNIVTYGLFDIDLRNSVLTLFDTIYGDMLKVKFIDNPLLSEYNIITNIIWYMNQVEPPKNDSVVIFYKSSAYNVDYGEDEKNVITKLLNPAEVICIDKKHFKGQ